MAASVLGLGQLALADPNSTGVTSLIGSSNIFVSGPTGAVTVTLNPDPIVDTIVANTSVYTALVDTETLQYH